MVEISKKCALLVEYFVFGASAMMIIYSLVNLCLSYGVFQTIVTKILYTGISLLFGIAVLGLTFFGIKRLKALDDDATKEEIYQITKSLNLSQIIFLWILYGLSQIYYVDYLYQEDCQHTFNSTNLLLKNSFWLKVDAANQFCSANCPCGLTNQSIETYYSNPDQKKFLYSLNRNGSVISTEQCPNVIAKKDDEGMKDALSFLTYIQNDYHCSEWCNSTSEYEHLLYQFSDVNNGMPTSFCYNYLKSQLQLRITLYATFVFGLATLMTLVCLISACCMRQEKHESNYIAPSYQPTQPLYKLVRVN